ncbi:MAG: hypothetical protein ACO2ZZ_10945 [Cyclobacteriaceae bacterium]
MRVKQLIILLLFLLGYESFAQKRALTRPFKFLKPTIETSDDLDARKSPYLWTVFVDREGVAVYKDKKLKNELDDRSLGFMDQYIVADETDNSLLLFVDPNIDSIDFSSTAREIGWVSKDRVVLWERFLWGSQKTKLLALSTWSKIESQGSALQPNSFAQKPSKDSRYYIFNVVKVDKDSGDVLLSLRTFNHRNKKLFCWVRKEDIYLVHDRNGYIPNREDILDFGANNPTIFDSRNGAVQKDLNEIAYYIDSLRADEGFFDLKGEIDDPVKYVQWMDDGAFKRGYMLFDPLSYDENKFVKGILVNRQEFSIMKKTVELLVRSRTREEYKNYWKRLYEENNLTLYEETGQYELFKELVQMEFNYKARSDGATMTEIGFLSDNEFNELKRQLELCLLGLIRAESDSDYPYNFAPFSYPHYWMPLDILPLSIFEKEYAVGMNDGSGEVVDNWRYDSELKNYQTFDLFYLDNSHDYNDSFDLKDRMIRSFYRRASRIRPEDPRRGSLVFYSNARNPAVGSGEKFTEDVAGMMRESVASRPNRRMDKKELRDHIYAKNIASVEVLRLHFYLGQNFYREAIGSNRWLLEEFVNELHLELNSRETEVILYLLNPPANQQEEIAKLNDNIPQGLKYRISIITL